MEVKATVPRLIFFLLPFFFTGCISFNAPLSGGAEARTEASHGYALLYDLMGNEKDVSKLLVVKRERVELRELIKLISQRCATAHENLTAFAKADTSLNLKKQGLPPVEVETRKAEGKMRGRELLTDSGKEFEVQLLLTQTEALTYGAQLAGVIAKTETNPARQEFLRQLSNDLTQLQKNVVDMLLANYSWSK